MVDVVIGIVFVLGSAFYIPRLSTFARLAEEAIAADASVTTESVSDAASFFLLGLIPWVGSFGILVPCLSFFSAPLPPLKRVMLGLLCAAPMAMAGLGIFLGPPGMSQIFLRLGFFCSLGIWLFALPGVLLNRGLNDVVYGLLGGKPRRNRTRHYAPRESTRFRP